MKRLISWCGGPKDLIALILIVTYCVSFICTALIPGIHFDELMSRQYERLMLMVVGFYFGSHRDRDRTQDKNKEKEHKKGE